MSFFSSITSGLSKGIAFIEKVFTQTENYATIVSKLTPTVLAAVLAVFYDVLKFIESSESVATDLTSGQVQAGISIFSSTTIGLLEKVWTDAKAGEANVVAAFKALELPTPPVTLPTS
jgi:hypothetical protein